MANYRVSTLITAETMQTNMSPLTDLDMHDQFAKPQSNSAVLLKKSTLPKNTVSLHIALFCSNNVKQNRSEKQYFKKENGNQMTFAATA